MCDSKLEPSEEEDEIFNDEDEPWYEPEDCECRDEQEDNGIEYTQEFTWENGTWVCDHCGKPQ